MTRGNRPVGCDRGVFSFVSLTLVSFRPVPFPQAHAGRRAALSVPEEHVFHATIGAKPPENPALFLSDTFVRWSNMLRNLRRVLSLPDVRRVLGWKRRRKWHASFRVGTSFRPFVVSCPPVSRPALPHGLREIYSLHHSLCGEFVLFFFFSAIFRWSLSFAWFSLFSCSALFPSPCSRNALRIFLKPPLKRELGMIRHALA